MLYLSLITTTINLVAVLLTLVAIPVWFFILVTGRYPHRLYRFTVALSEWAARLFAWQWFMRDEVPWIEASRRVTVGILAVALIPAIFVAINITDTAFLAGGTNWRAYTPTDQSYTIDFPGDPDETTESFPSPGGPLELHFAEFSTTTSFFFVLVTELGSFDRDQGLGAPSVGLLVSQRARFFRAGVVADERIVMASQDTRAVTFAVRGADDLVWYRLFDDDDVLFELLVGSESLLGLADANRFFDSFELH